MEGPPDVDGPHGHRHEPRQRTCGGTSALGVVRRACCAPRAHAGHTCVRPLQDPLPKRSPTSSGTAPLARSPADPLIAHSIPPCRSWPCTAAACTPSRAAPPTTHGKCSAAVWGGSGGWWQGRREGAAGWRWHGNKWGDSGGWRGEWRGSSARASAPVRGPLSPQAPRGRRCPARGRCPEPRARAGVCGGGRAGQSVRVPARAPGRTPAKTCGAPWDGPGPPLRSAAGHVKAACAQGGNPGNPCRSPAVGSPGCRSGEPRREPLTAESPAGLPSRRPPAPRAPRRPAPLAPRGPTAPRPLGAAPPAPRERTAARARLAARRAPRGPTAP